MDCAHCGFSTNCATTHGRVHLCHGNPGTLASSSCLLGQAGPCVFPWTAHWVVFCPIMCAPQIIFATCKPHKDMEWPEWSDKALVYTEHGIVGKSEMNHAAPTHAILWGAFDVDKVQVRKYDGPRGWQQTGCCDNGKAGLNAAPIDDPLTCTLQVGLLGPCCARICVQPDNVPGLYHLVVESTHITRESGENGATYPTGRIGLIALAPDPEACLEELRSMAGAAAAAPVPAAMARGDVATSPQLRARSGCNIM